VLSSEGSIELAHRNPLDETHQRTESKARGVIGLRAGAIVDTILCNHDAHQAARIFSIWFYPLLQQGYAPYSIDKTDFDRPPALSPCLLASPEAVSIEDSETFDSNTPAARCGTTILRSDQEILSLLVIPSSHHNTSLSLHLSCNRRFFLHLAAIPSSALQTTETSPLRVAVEGRGTNDLLDGDGLRIVPACLGDFDLLLSAGPSSVERVLLISEVSKTDPETSKSHHGSGGGSGPSHGCSRGA